MVATLSKPPVAADAPAVGDVSTPTPSADLQRRPALIRALRADASPLIDDKAMASHGRPGIEPVSAEAWVARIVKLREAGEDDAADREVEALRRRYPGFAIPPDALHDRRER